VNSHSLMRTQLPYVLRRTSDGQWIALNREYTPLGTIGGDPCASYNNHPSRMRLDVETIAYLRGVTAHLVDMGDKPCTHAFSIEDHPADFRRAVTLEFMCIYSRPTLIT
jgi:hypothetical protein